VEENLHVTVSPGFSCKVAVKTVCIPLYDCATQCCSAYPYMIVAVKNVCIPLYDCATQCCSAYPYMIVAVKTVCIPLYDCATQCCSAYPYMIVAVKTVCIPLYDSATQCCIVVKINEGIKVYFAKVWPPKLQRHWVISLFVLRSAESLSETAVTDRPQGVIIVGIYMFSNILLLLS